jgi:hypothetical protein
MYELTHLSARSSGTTSQEKMPKSMARTMSRSIRSSTSKSFGPMKKRAFDGAVG